MTTKYMSGKASVSCSAASAVIRQEPKNARIKQPTARIAKPSSHRSCCSEAINSPNMRPSPPP
eukprot:3633611-Pleurochrysis_carterae.AAC.1